MKKKLKNILYIIKNSKNIFNNTIQQAEEIISYYFFDSKFFEKNQRKCKKYILEKQLKGLENSQEELLTIKKRIERINDMISEVKNLIIIDMESEEKFIEGTYFDENINMIVEEEYYISKSFEDLDI